MTKFNFGALRTDVTKLLISCSLKDMGWVPSCTLGTTIGVEQL